MGASHFSGPLWVAGVQITDASGNLIAPVEMADLDQIVDENGNELLEFDSNASAVNHIVIENSATGVNPKIYAGGEADTGITFENSESEEMLVLDAVATAVNHLEITNAATGNPILVSVEGEADVGMEFHAKDGEQMLILAAATAAVNEVTITSAATGANPTISATGEANTGLDFENSEGEEILILNSIATSVNEFTVASAATGSGPQLEATGDDTNINMELIPKGTGYVDVQNGGLQVVAQSVTPNNDSGTASTIEDGAIHVDVGAVTTDANDWIVLPSLANVPVGHTIKIACNAGTNFELRTPASSNEKINNVDSDGTQEYLCTDTEMLTVTKLSDTDGWVATAQTLLGAIATAVIPD